MIILKVIGGLGNQMFEVAFARALALEYNEEIYVDTSAYKKYKIRSFSLSNLKISDILKPIEDAKLSKSYKLYLKFTQKFYHLYQKMLRVITMSDRIGEKHFKLLARIGLCYNFDRYYYDVIFNVNKNRIKCIYGYFQSEKYFKKYKKQIIEELKVKIPPTDKEKRVLEEIMRCNAVGVSIRLGDDYKTLSYLNVCKEDFYYKGMEYIYNKYRDVVFFIFSDCIDCVKKQFKFKYPVYYVEGFNDYQSLRLLYSCKNFVIANSSFSWWGAYLSDNPDKMIIAPNRWYNNSKEKPDIYLDNMVLLEV